jgi:murein DD-endopeptidase MepM/ murein hydrolase activator NlpD
MNKLFNVVAATMLAVTLMLSSLLSNILTDAASVSNISINNLTISSISSSSLISSSTKPETRVKKKIKIINNEIQEEDGIILNKKDQERYDKCKKEVASKRVKRFKNKPTPCLKMTNTESNKDSHITPEDYNILWATVAENKDLMNTKVDPNLELPLSTYLNLDEIEIVNNSSSSSTLSLSSIISTTSNSQSNFSSVSDANSISSSSVVVSTSSSSSITTQSTTSKSSSTIQNSLSGISNTPSNTSPASTQALTSSSKTSWLNNILNLGTIKVNAAINDGFKLPYANGVSVRLEQSSFNEEEGPPYWNPGEHASHWDYAAFDFTAGSITKIVASKPGTVLYSASGGGFGEHVVVVSSDGAHTLYAHLSERKVSLGDTISQAQQIGVQGNTGLGGGSAHLHFETFNKYPCNKTYGTDNKIENCFVPFTGGYKGFKGNDYYLASVMKPIFVECANDVNCKEGRPEVYRKYYTSQNTPPSPRPQVVDNSMSRVQPPVDNWDRALDSSCSLNSIVMIWKRNDGDCQKMKYDYGTNSLRNPFGQCLDAGAGSRKLTFFGCNNSDNQKWFHEPGDGRIWSKQLENGTNKPRCIECSE